MVGAVPWDLSRRTFMQLAASPEAFLMLRSHFIKTYSTLCICHYVLGIGDRHLSNFMVDLRSGGMVGIDFGHAFGTATQVCVYVCVFSCVHTCMHACTHIFYCMLCVVMYLVYSCVSMNMGVCRIV